MRPAPRVPLLAYQTVSARAWDGERVTLPWIMVHMVEEYARHNGHAGFLRERIDGLTGE